MLENHSHSYKLSIDSIVDALQTTFILEHITLIKFTCKYDRKNKSSWEDNLPLLTIKYDACRGWKLQIQNKSISRKLIEYHIRNENRTI